MRFSNDEKQMVMIYTAYMMIGSEFHHTHCAQKNLEKKMRQLYLLTAEKEQIRIENACEAFARTELKPRLPKDFFLYDADVRFGRSRGGLRVIEFASDCYTLDIIMTNGKCIDFSYDFRGSQVVDAASVRKLHYSSRFMRLKKMA